MTDAQLMAAIVAAYMLSERDIASLAQRIAEARLRVAQASYRDAQRTVGLSGRWTPPGAYLRQIERRAEQEARGIARTYKEALSRVVETIFAGEKTLAGASAKGWRDVFGTIGQAISSVIEQVGAWLRDFIGWKAPQIAGDTCGSGKNDGMDAFIEETYGNEVDPETGEAINWQDYAVTVLPPESSPDACSDYAGMTFDLSEYATIPSFPMHPGCPHYKTIIQIR